jgi:transcriptional regulator
MYLPPHFREDDLAAQHDLIRAHPLGQVFTAGPNGLMANPIPCLVYPEGERGTIRLHLARANPQAAELRAVADCLIAFQGAQRYVTPAWYATKRETGKVVPTWNYATVHVWGRPTVIEDPSWIRRQIEDLTNSQEGQRLDPWSVHDAPEAYVASQIQGIVGVEIPILRIEGKWKVSQNRPEADRLGVVAGFREQGAEGAAMADLVERRGGPRA